MTREEWLTQLGQALAAARKAAGLSQADLAALLGVHRQTVYRWEAADQVLDVWHWSRVRAVLPGLTLPEAV